VSDHYGTRGKLTPAEILREITGGGDPPVEGIPEAIGTSEDFPLTTRPGEYLAQPREPEYRVGTENITLEGVEQTVKIVEIHRQIQAVMFAAGVVGPDVPFGPAPTKPQREGDQQPPTPNNLPEIHDLVCGDIQARKRLGTERYGTPLQPHNGRDALRDHYEELLDACAYARQMLFERDGQ